MKNYGYILMLLFLAFVSCRDVEHPVVETTRSVTVSATDGRQQFKDSSCIDSVQMKIIYAGNFTPLFGKIDSLVHVDSFLLDEIPVTNQRYLQFVKQNIKWRRSHTTKLFADGNYLYDWKNDTVLADNQLQDAPITNVSWFAAEAYCECMNKTLPTTSQWEYTGNSGELLPDQRRNKKYNQYILGWYEKPKTFSNPVRNTYKNYWGIWDMHGLVWEWTYDFNEVMISGESRRDVSNDNSAFCGSGSVGANDLMNYAAFMRFAFRGSLKAKYSIKNLGFRCAKKINKL